MRPLLAHIYEPHRVSYPCYVQPKLNGIRALYQNGCFQSRDELPFTSGLLDHLARPLQQLFGPEVILDGELYKHGWPLQRINGAVTPVRQEPNEDTLQVEYHVFDIVNYGTSFSDRFESMIRRELPLIKRIRTVHCGTEALANELYVQFVADGYEGMMYRLGTCPYSTPKQLRSEHPIGREVGSPITKFLSDKDNRCWHLLKRKDWQDDEFQCLGVEEGQGKLQGMLGALLCATKHKQVPTTFHVGSGLTDFERQHYWANPPIGKKIKVKYLVLSNDNIPLNPTILAIL